MGIDIMFLREEDGKRTQDGDEEERVASHWQFANLSLMLTHLLDLVKSIDDPAIAETMQIFWDFVADGAEEKIQCYDEYCYSINGARKKALEVAGEGAEMIFGLDQDLDPGEIAPEVRSFIAGFMLTNGSVAPEVTEIMMVFIYVAQGFMSAAAEHLHKKSPKMAQAMGAAEETLRAVSEFGQKAVDEKRLLFFSA
jgi:hypothetical protein